MAEGFGFQTLQTLQPTHSKARDKQDSPFTKAGPDKTEAGPVVTTRRVVAPKSGPVGRESESFEERVAAEGYLSG